MNTFLILQQLEIIKQKLIAISLILATMSSTTPAKLGSILNPTVKSDTSVTLLNVSSAYPLYKEQNKEIYKMKLADDDVIIGNEKNASTTDAQIKFTKWNNEESLILKFLGMNGIADTTNGKIVLGDIDKEFYAFQYATDTLKFGMNFKTKPASNVITFQLEGWENFDFLYQPPLQYENVDGSTWEYNVWGLKSYRPAGISGGYEVYHKTKRDYIVGQTNYGIGKFGQFEKPKFIDAKGNWTWGELNIKDNIYTVTIPQKFLDDAIYPIRANDTFGNNGVGASTDSTPNNLSFIIKAYTTPSFNGSLTSTSIHAGADSGTTDIFNALYSDGDGTTNTKLAGTWGTGDATIGTTHAWATSTLAYASITSGTQYWLGWGTSSGYYGEEYTTDASAKAAYINAGSFPSTYSGSTARNTYRYSTYGTYTPSVTVWSFYDVQ